MSKLSLWLNGQRRWNSDVNYNCGKVAFGIIIVPRMTLHIFFSRFVVNLMMIVNLNCPSCRVCHSVRLVVFRKTTCALFSDFTASFERAVIKITFSYINTET